MLKDRGGLRVPFLALLIVAGCCAGAFAAAYERTSEHFLITYDARPGGRTTDEPYVAMIEDGMEAAYAIFDRAGFPLYPERIRVDIVNSSLGELGAQYLDADDDGDWVPVIEIATQSIMEEYLAYAYVDSSLEDLVDSTCAHELFHTIQEYASWIGAGDVSEQSFVEAHATAIQEFVVPSANDYLEPGIDFLLAPDSIAFFERTYDAGVFWVYVIDRFGVQAIADVMASSAVYDGRYAVDDALRKFGESFFDVWTDFAVALATEGLPDSEAIATLVPQSEREGWWTTTRASEPIPPPVFSAVWTGSVIDATTVNAAQGSEVIPMYDDDPIGTSLRVAHAYGIDVLKIELSDPSPIEIRFDGDPGTEFRTVVATESENGWTAEPFVTSIVLHPDVNAARIRIVVTRTEAGSGEYAVTLRPQ